jgi:2-polyprenyl-3-methyl-5-hydroxy-6-metoxy-1,4-benzoquinol methylase
MSVHTSSIGAIRLRHQKRTGALTYVQRGGNQSAIDMNGVSLDTYIHAIYGMAIQLSAKTVLMIGCGGGVLGKMLDYAGRRVTVVDIDRASFRLAKRYFGLPSKIECVVGDGLAFMQKTRRRFDLVIIDAFIGEKIPPQFTGDDLCRAVHRCVRSDGTLFMNVCLDDKKDMAADKIAARFKMHGVRARLLDQSGSARNAIVLAGQAKGLKKPELLCVPQTEAPRIKRELGRMRFRASRVKKSGVRTAS